MISKKDIEHLGKLARIDVFDRDREALAKDFMAILEYVAVLGNVEVSENSFRHLSYLGADLRNDGREDVDEDTEARRAYDLLDAAPEKERGYVKVKSVLEK